MRQRILFLAYTAILLFACFLNFSSLTIGADADDVKSYKDKNSYFIFKPPEGWIIQEFSNNLTSKIECKSPDGLAIVGINAWFGDDVFGNLVVDKKEYVRDHQLRFPQGKFNFSKTSVAGFKAVKIDYEIPPAVKEELYYFFAEGLRFDLTFGVSDASVFQKYRNEALDAFSSIKPLGVTQKGQNHPDKKD